MRPGREPLMRDRDARDRERLLPEGIMQQHERERERDRDGRAERGADRERERMMMMDLPPLGDPRAPGRGDARQERVDYEPLLPREAFSPAEEKPSNSHQAVGDQRELEKNDSVDGKGIDAEPSSGTCL